MDEIVASVQRVTDIIGEISAAALEQSQGIGQVNEAVTRLDQMTQQNAALVEQSAAAAESLKDQAHRMTTVVASFRVDGSVQAAPVARIEPRPAPAAKPVAAAAPKAPAAKPVAKPVAAAKPAPAPAPVAAPVAAGATDEWESF
jgi:uncharacterized phage infection (PIP) family protein YhgE